MSIHEIRIEHTLEDSEAARLSREVRAEFGEDIGVQTADVYYVEGVDVDEAAQLARDLLTNPVTQRYRVEPRTGWDDSKSS